MPSMRIGILNGGGDCPGLNAVIRAVVLTAALRHGDEVIGFIDGWKGVLDDDAVALDVPTVPRHPGAGRDDPGDVADQPLHRRGRARPGARHVARPRRGRARGRGGRGHAGRRTSPRGPRRQRRGRPEDDRQRPVGDRGDLRVRHRRADRHRRHRPVAHDGRVPSPRHRVRGHGSPRWDGSPPTQGSPAARPRSSCPRSPSTSTTCADGCNGAMPVGSSRRSSSSPKARSRCRAPRPTPPGSPRRVPRSTNSATPGWAGSAPGWPRSSSGGPASRRGTTILGHVQRGGTPSAFDRVLATRFGVAAVEAVHDGAFGQMVALRAGEIVRVPLAEAVARVQDRRPRPLRGRRRGVPGLGRHGARGVLRWPARGARC